MQYLLADENGLRVCQEKPDEFNYKIGSQKDPELEVWTKKKFVRFLLWHLLCIVMDHPEIFIKKVGDDGEISSDNLS